jgi:hypothetical protein
MGVYNAHVNKPVDNTTIMCVSCELQYKRLTLGRMYGIVFCVFTCALYTGY